MEFKIDGPYSKPQKAAAGYTGEWRIFRPVIDEEKCIRCLQCWMHCPDSIFDPQPTLEDNEPPVIDYDFCKGCGVCANICPADAIEMIRETEFKGED